MHRLLIASLLSASAAACGTDHDPAGPREGPLPFDAAGINDIDAGPELINGCPPLREPLAMPGDPIDGDDLTTFALPFFQNYCVRCHSTTLVGDDARNFAPEMVNWDDEMNVRAYLATAPPAGTPRLRLYVGEINFMPIGDPLPTCDERMRLVRWLDADAP